MAALLCHQALCGGVAVAERKRRKRRRSKRRVYSEYSGAGTDADDEMNDSESDESDDEMDAEEAKFEKELMLQRTKDMEREKARKRALREAKLKAMAVGSGGNPLMGNRDLELLDPGNRYGIWHRYVDFPSFYRWYMRDGKALKYRLRAPLEGACCSFVAFTFLFSFCFVCCRCFSERGWGCWCCSYSTSYSCL